MSAARWAVLAYLIMGMLATAAGPGPEQPTAGEAPALYMEEDFTDSGLGCVDCLDEAQP